MALTKSKTFSADQVVVAWQAGMIDGVDGAPFVWQRGTRLKASHAAVIRMGRGAFIEDGTPESEWPHSIDAVVEEQDKQATKAPKPPPRIDPKTPVGELLIATRGITASKVGPIPLGTVLHRSDERIAELNEAGWRPLVERLG